MATELLSPDDLASFLLAQQIDQQLDAGDLQRAISHATSQAASLLPPSLLAPPLSHVVAQGLRLLAAAHVFCGSDDPPEQVPVPLMVMAFFRLAQQQQR